MLLSDIGSGSKPSFHGDVTCIGLVLVRMILPTVCNDIALRARTCVLTKVKAGTCSGVTVGTWPSGTARFEVLGRHIRLAMPTQSTHVQAIIACSFQDSLALLDYHFYIILYRPFR